VQSGEIAGWAGPFPAESGGVVAQPVGVARTRELERHCQALAVLEAILCPEPRWRYFSFDPMSRPGQRVAKMEAATGDGWLIWFSPEGVVIRGFDHESPVSPWRRNPVEPWPGLFDGLPAKLRHGPRLKVEGVESITFCLWWDVGDPGWRTGVVAQPDAKYGDPDGSGWLLAELVAPVAYQGHAEEVHERVVPLDVIEGNYGHQPLTPGLIGAIDSVQSILVRLRSQWPPRRRSAIRSLRRRVHLDRAGLGSRTGIQFRRLAWLVGIGGR
jgi:hypothetical protein